MWDAACNHVLRTHLFEDRWHSSVFELNTKLTLFHQTSFTFQFSLDYKYFRGFQETRVKTNTTPNTMQIKVLLVV